ncbi:aspartate aminotransferase family protein [Peptococcaceae bacterium]|nr:aspartate aminotransferase family protein [Peptococcaceae bacterium]
MSDICKEYLMNTYKRIPIVMVRGEGIRLWDDKGNKYMDFVSGLGVNSLGHSHPKVTKAIWRQAATLIHVSNLYYIEQQCKLAKELCDNSFADKVFFCNSGAEAVEGAIKLARKHAKVKGYKNKYEIITAYNSFHGRTYGAITATAQSKYQESFKPLVPGFKYVPFNDIDAISSAISEETCAVMLEPVQGEGGVYPADEEYLKQVRKLCDEREILLIFDEVQCGLGRTGRLFAHQRYGVTPDICTVAKALGNGFPIGAVLATDDAAVFEPGDHASTFGGNPLACEVALAVLEVMLESAVENAYKMGEYFKDALIELKRKYSVIKEVRGMGLMLGVEFSRGLGELVVDLCKNGLLVNCINNRILRFLPPLIVTKEDIDRAIAMLDESIEKLFNDESKRR